MMDSKFVLMIIYTVVCILLGAVILSGILIFFALSPGDVIPKDYEVIEAQSKQDIVDVCDNLDLKTSAKCIRDNIKPIFNYTLTKDSTILTFTELKTIGGDCKDWNTLIADIGNDLGFNGETYRFDITDMKGHRFAKISDETGYCILDQRKLVGCFTFGGQNESA